MALLLFVVFNACAQENPVSLNTILNRLEHNAPSLITDSAAILIRQAQALEARNNWLPNLKLNYQADLGSNNNVAGPYFGFGLIPSNSRGVRSQSNNNASLSNLGIAALDWEIYNFGAYSAERKTANSAVEVQQNQYQLSKFQLQTLTINQYLQLMLDHDLLQIQKANINRNQDIERSIRALAKSGVRAGVDTSIAAAELSKAKLNYLELSNQMKQVQLQLGALTGLSYQTIQPDTTAESILLQQSGLLSSGLKDSLSHPLLRYYQSAYQNALQKQEMIKKQYNPKILLEAAFWGRGSSITAEDQFRNLSTGWGFDRNNYLLGIGVSYNLTDLKRRQLKLHTQQVSASYDRKKYLEQQELLSLRNGQAETELSTARQRLKEIPNQLKAANAGYRQKFSLYKNGLTDIIELNAALNILYRAETDFALARNTYCRALFEKAAMENQVSTLLKLLN